MYAQCLLELVGVNPVPRYTADHNDIVTCFDSGSAAALQGFCAGIQSCSPVDSFVSSRTGRRTGLYRPGHYGIRFLYRGLYH